MGMFGRWFKVKLKAISVVPTEDNTNLSGLNSKLHRLRLGVRYHRGYYMMNKLIAPYLHEPVYE